MPFFLEYGNDTVAPVDTKHLLILQLNRLKSLLHRHFATSVFEFADSIQTAPVASKRRGQLCLRREVGGVEYIGRVRDEDRQRETGRPSHAAPLLFLGPDRSDLDDLIVFVMHFRKTRH